MSRHPLAIVRPADKEHVEHHDSLNWTTTVRADLDGQLAQRVRRRFDLAKDANVWVEELRSEWGTDYTRETHVEFNVGCADRTVTFTPDSTLVGWDPERARSETIYDRFNTWLDAGHRDARTWETWVDERSRDAAGRYAKIELHVGAALSRAACSYSNGRALSSVYLWGERTGGRWGWKLDGVTPESEHFYREKFDDVFKPLEFRRPLQVQTRSCAETRTDRRAILIAVTDLVCP